MFKYLSSLLMCSIVFSSLPFANASSLKDWQEATVKVRSYPCLTGRPALEGSGVIVKTNGKVAIWTSEHVVLHSNAATFCHEVTHPSGLKEKVTLAQVSFLSGLAVLETSAKELSVKAVSILPTPQSQTVSEVVALGYPQGSGSLQTLTEGKLISDRSPRAQIPSVHFTLEASQLPVEYGMSGGALLARNQDGTYSLAGILSHQVLKRRASQGTVSESLTSGDLGHATDLALAIPTSEVLRLLNTPKAITATRDTTGQLRGEEVIQYGPLSFKMKSGSFEDLFGIGGFNRGGADGSGIGGADGTGIGGSSLFPPSGESFNSVEVFFSSNSKAEDKSLTLSHASLEGWRQQLLRGSSVQVPYFRLASEVRLQNIGSLSQFFKLLLSEQHQPVGILSRKDSPSADFALELQSLALKAQALRESSNNVALVAWLGWLRDQALLAQNGLLTSQQLLQLLEETPDLAWQEFYVNHFDAAVALNSHIQKAAACMKARGL